MKKAVKYGRRKTLDVALYRLWKKGWIKYVDKEGERFLKLTRHGEIEALLIKTYFPPQMEWDGKWRMFIFDIPESAKEKRDVLRKLLKKNSFKKLQASVYV